MTKQCLLKFREDVNPSKKDTILNANKIVKCLDTFGIYMISLEEENIVDLRKDQDILYVKETKK